MQVNRMFPANLLKFNAYIKVVDSLEAAIDVIKKKRLAYGEPCVVTYKTSSSTENPVGTQKRVLFGVGSMDPDEPYFFNVEYGSDGKPIEQTEMLEKVQKIIDEWDKHGGFTVTAIKFSKTEPSNINDTEFAYGDIILGEASIKRVINTVSKTSKDLVTSEGIYRFITNLISSIETTVNNLNAKVNAVVKDVSTLASDVSVIKVNQNKLISDVSVIKVNQNKLISDISTLVSDVSVIKVNQNKLISDVSVLKAHDASTILGVISDSCFIKAETINKVVKLNIDVEKGFSNSFMQDASGKIALAWDKYEE